MVKIYYIDDVCFFMVIDVEEDDYCVIQVLGFLFQFGNGFVIYNCYLVCDLRFLIFEFC